MEIEIPAQLQERTDLLLQELRARLGKDAANRFVLMRSAIYYINEIPRGVDPQELAREDSSYTDESWKFDFTYDSDHRVRDTITSSNEELDNLLGSSRLELVQPIPLCTQCTCEKCKKRRVRAGQRVKKQGSLDVILGQFPRTDLIDILAKYWETLKVRGLFSDQPQESPRWSKLNNSPVHVQRLRYHLILRKLEIEDDLHCWRRFVAEHRILEGYNDFHREATTQRINGMQARASGENDNNKAHKEYVKHLFPDQNINALLVEQAALKKDLQFARRWAIWVDGYAEKKGSLVPGLGVGVGLLVGQEIKKRMCERIGPQADLAIICADVRSSYSTADYDHSYLKSLLKHIHEVQPNIVSMCRVIEPAALSLVRNHRLSSHDNWDALFTELGQYI